MDDSVAEASSPAGDAPSSSRAVSGRSRELGHSRGARPGPTLVLIGGVHGNEPGGVAAIRAVLGQLGRVEHRGEVVGLAGNLAALERGVRCNQRDLNRGWSEERLAALLDADPSTLANEDLEQRQLAARLAELSAQAVGPMAVLDLHSMSGPGAPFTCMADVVRNRKLAFGLPIPVVLGLEEVLDASLIGWLCEQGHMGIAVEGGRHDDPELQARLEAIIWLSLVSSGLIEAGRVPGLKAHRARLEKATEGLPAVVEIEHRHACRDNDGFHMEPGFRSFDPVKRRQLLARDVRGEVRAPRSGLLLLPRYQGSGDDGFFLVGKVSKAWLGVSAGLRKLEASRLLPKLPGVVAHPEDPETFLVDPRTARFKVADVFHLLGYRRVRPDGAQLSFSRRRSDGQRPKALPGPRKPPEEG